ncbi:hypothetical protein Lal_00000518 [Lupinus albus]|nr:hypothetical protein Lal_00000518 [Lupinus albus]
MENERVRNTKNDGKKKHYNSVLLSSNISNGGGKRIAGLLVLGGAMAVAGYVAVLSLHSFVTNKKKAKEKSKSAVTENEPKPQQLSLEDGCKSQGHGDNHTETTSNCDGDALSACHVTYHMNIKQPSILKEETDSDLNISSELVSPNNFHHQEIVLHDDSHPESVASSSSNENEIAEEDGPQQSLDSLQTETKDDDEDDNIESEKEENSSKETEGKGTNESDTQTHEAEEKDIAASDVTSLYGGTNMAMNVKANLSEGLNYQPSTSYSVQLITWLIPMLLHALLLIPLKHLVKATFSK